VEGEDWMHTGQNMDHRSVVPSRTGGWMIGGSSTDRGWEFFLHHRVQTDYGTHPASYPMGTKDSFPGGKADHSPPSDVEVKNAFLAWCSVKAQSIEQ